MIGRERTRLRRLFRGLVLASLAAPGAGVYACSSANETTPGDGGVDATSGVDSGGGDAPGDTTTNGDTSRGDANDGGADLDANVNCTPSHLYQSEAGYVI